MLPLVVTLFNPLYEQDELLRTISYQIVMKQDDIFYKLYQFVAFLLSIIMVNI